MDLLETQKSPLKRSLTSISNGVAILALINVAIVVLLIDFALGITMQGVSFGRLAVVIGMILPLPVLLLLGAFKTTKGQIALHIYLHIIVIYALASIVPITSPFFVFMIGPPLLTYYAFGLKAVIFAMSVTGVALSVEFIVRHGVSKEQFGRFIISYICMLIILAYVLTFLKIANDERQALEEVTHQIELERSRLLTLVNNLNDAVLACDAEFNVILYNPKLKDMLGVEHSLRGRKLDHLLDLRDVDGQPIKLSHLADTEQHVSVYTSYRLHYSERDFINLYIGVNQITHGRAKPSGYVILLRDITKVKSLEEERNEFIYIMSHELRTPVSIVEGGISLAREFVKAKDTAKALDSLEKAHYQSVMLGSIVSSLAMLVNTGKGDQKAQISEIEPQQVIDKIKKTYQQEVHAKGLKFVAHNDPNIRTIYTNQEYLFEIMQNLMTNAIKYTTQGSITVSVQAPTKSHVSFSVKDTGIGISKSDQNHIFEKFWRSEDYKTRKSGGTGLGLYLTKKLADNISARIEVDSTLGEGSTFTIHVPVYDTQEI